MVEDFKIFIAEKKLFEPTETVLLAVSGGLDSVVMCELFHRSKFKFAIAHCNFKLRGKESDMDERFVKSLSVKYRVPFYVKNLPAEHYSKEKKISVQMAARELRYQWFDKLCNDFNFRYVAIATQLDDQVETVLMNLIRGTGISGLHGIAVKKERIIRPLMFCTRSEILEFAAQNSLKWREDSSNKSIKYIRNKIRHKVIPVLKQVNPSLEKSIASSIQRIKDAEEIYHQMIDEKRRALMKEKKSGEIVIDKKELLVLSPLKTYLFEFLKPYNFNETVIAEIADNLKDQPGKVFFSTTHSLLLDRKELIINKITSSEENPEYLLNLKSPPISRPFKLTFKIAEEDFEILKDPNTAFLDFEKLTFPLVLRPWKAGDSFIPLGMQNEKKISDFLIDIKISLSKKKDVYVLTSLGKIAWVVGFRIDERFKISGKTKKAFIVRKG